MCVVSEDKFPSFVRDISKLWRCKWMVLLSVVRGRNRIPTTVKKGAAFLRSNASLYLKPYMGLGLEYDKNNYLHTLVYQSCFY